MDVNQKQQLYDQIIPLLKIAFNETQDETARMATVAALLFKHFNPFFWVGFYVLRGEVLTVGPYIGAPALVTLPADTGVCWRAMSDNRTLVIDNVHEFEGHIRVEGASNSEISVPLRASSGEARGVLHIDHADFNAFDQTDVNALEQIATMLDG